ncbi:helix-turn-helix domain-containing protein [Frigoriflavimonas asaccharolytica]|uniref:Transcriptional regulator with XRE-family HTH domain n=1 Tax=Frigoriflavimonas asaccharolytica TaxID=2735899 RepID=A0A8J8G8C6_9FLAO|nr:helix-turn-helix domain-containing protein [Frigoriflavimonas asaccharolytica]NRS91364.1 transcriptional regulator with XRE-family HTH domain [Frigoriflavimonas asaccharolytica]
MKTKLHDTRTKRNYTQKELATLAAMSQPKYSRKESGYDPILKSE